MDSPQRNHVEWQERLREVEALRDAAKFHWRDLRDFSLGIAIWPLHWWPWFEFNRDDDRFGGRITLTLGPLCIFADYNAHDGPFGKPLNPEDQSR